MIRPYLKAAIFLLCMMQASCLPDSKPLQMPDTFLGEWIHEDGRFRYQINADGTITDTFIEDNQICTLMEYKVLRVYSPKRVAVLYRERNSCTEKTDWFGPMLGVFYAEPPYEYTSFLGETYRWDITCYIASKDAWVNTEKYKKDLLSRVRDDIRGCKQPRAQDLIRRRK